MTDATEPLPPIRPVANQGDPIVRHRARQPNAAPSPVSTGNVTSFPVRHRSRPTGGIGLALLHRIVVDQDSQAFDRLLRDWFLEGELPAFDFIAGFVRDHGELPTEQVARENGIALSGADQGPLTYQIERLRKRAIYNGVLRHHGSMIEAINGRDMDGLTASVRAMHEDVTRLEAAISTRPNTGTDAAQLQATEFPEQRWLVPGYIPETGISLIAGRPKIGKSWLMLNIATAVANGNTVLAQQAQQGGVLYLALEDTGRRIRDRLNVMLGATRWPSNLRFETEWPRIGQGGEAELRGYIERHPDTRLIIVDTLVRVRPEENDRGSVYNRDYAAITPLKDIADLHGVAVVVVHHLRKTVSDDPFDEVSGSTGLMGAVDTGFVLKRQTNSSTATLYGRGRDVAEFDKALEINPETMTWREIGDAEAHRLNETQRQILAAMEAWEGEMSPAEVHAETGIDRINTVRVTMSRMARNGLLYRSAPGRYRIARTTSPWGGDNNEYGETPPDGLEWEQ